MRKIIIMTDSTSDLPASFVESNRLTIVPLYVNFGDQAYRDGVDIDPSQLYKIVAETGVFPKTSSPSPKDFLNAFTPAIETGHDILYVGLSSRLSSTIQNARIAAAEFEDHRIEIIDSLNLSAGIGLLVMTAINLNQGEEIKLKDLADYIRMLVPNVRTYFAVDNLEYLHKGGRCSALENLVGSMLRIRPILHVIDGQIVVHSKVRGKRDKLLSEMLDLVNPQEASPDLMLVNHSMCPEDAEALKDRIHHKFQDASVLITQAGCVISSHCGPKTFSVVYIKK